jgi:hypothetical protein
MIWIILAAIVLAAVVLWMLIETKSTLHLLWVIPVCLGLLVGTYSWAYSMFGYPTDIYKENEEFTLISYFVPNEEDKIIIWVLLNGEESPKSIIIPYTPEEEESLQKVAQQMAAGQRFMGQFAKKLPESKEDVEANEKEGESGGGTLKSAGGMLNFRELTVKHFLPKKGYIEEEI